MSDNIGSEINNLTVDQFETVLNLYSAIGDELKPIVKKRVLVGVNILNIIFAGTVLCLLILFAIKRRKDKFSIRNFVMGSTIKWERGNMVFMFLLFLATLVSSYMSLSLNREEDKTRDVQYVASSFGCISGVFILIFTFVLLSLNNEEWVNKWLDNKEKYTFQKMVVSKIVYWLLLFGIIAYILLNVTTIYNYDIKPIKEPVEFSVLSTNK